VEHLAISVRRATPQDAGALAALVNEAYAIEKAFLDGERTSVAEIAAMCEPGARGVFLVLEQAGGLAAAVWLERRDGAQAYFGMLSVAPGLQGMGLGKRLVRIAEAMAEATGASEMRLRIINLREELGRWYRSLGYREVGTTPFDGRGARRPCHFVDMSKDLGVEAALEAGFSAA
jgi:GNAT superfamily N-acetyltransferase